MTIILGTIELPVDLSWVDEFDWTPVEDVVDTALSGSLVIQTGTRAKGRPITLAGSDDQAWITRETLEAIQALADSPPTSLTLSFHSRPFSVRFRYGEKPITASPVVFYSGDPIDTDYYTVTLRLMEV